jgi:hypothetical protein
MQDGRLAHALLLTKKALQKYPEFTKSCFSRALSGSPLVSNKSIVMPLLVMNAVVIKAFRRASTLVTPDFLNRPSRYAYQLDMFCSTTAFGCLTEVEAVVSRLKPGNPLCCTDLTNATLLDIIRHLTPHDGHIDCSMASTIIANAVTTWAHAWVSDVDAECMRQMSPCLLSLAITLAANTEKGASFYETVTKVVLEHRYQLVPGPHVHVDERMVCNRTAGSGLIDEWSDEFLCVNGIFEERCWFSRTNFYSARSRRIVGIAFSTLIEIFKCEIRMQYAPLVPIKLALLAKTEAEIRRRCTGYMWTVKTASGAGGLDDDATMRVPYAYLCLSAAGEQRFQQFKGCEESIRKRTVKLSGEDRSGVMQGDVGATIDVTGCGGDAASVETGGGGVTDGDASPVLGGTDRQGVTKRKHIADAPAAANSKRVKHIGKQQPSIDFVASPVAAPVAPAGAPAAAPAATATAAAAAAVAASAAAPVVDVPVVQSALYRALNVATPNDLINAFSRLPPKKQNKSALEALIGLKMSPYFWRTVKVELLGIPVKKQSKKKKS